MAPTWIAADCRERLVCDCGYVHYENPHLLVVCIVEWEGCVLMCRRAQPPSVGLWTPPAGFMEMGETLEQAAVRETREETGVEVDPSTLDLHMVSSVPWMSQVYVGFRATLARAPRIEIGPESQDARFFAEHDIPWGELAFPETTGYLQIHFRERAAGSQGIHVTRIDDSGGYRREYQVSGSHDLFQAEVASSRPR